MTPGAVRYLLEEIHETVQRCGGRPAPLDPHVAREATRHPGDVLVIDGHALLTHAGVRELHRLQRETVELGPRERTVQAHRASGVVASVARAVDRLAPGVYRSSQIAVVAGYSRRHVRRVLREHSERWRIEPVQVGNRTDWRVT